MATGDFCHIEFPSTDIEKTKAFFTTIVLHNHLRLDVPRHSGFRDLCDVPHAQRIGRGRERGPEG